jgi:RNA polymerase sigma-70 factor (ECF subfamily)
MPLSPEHAALYEAGRAAWPEVVLEPDLFGRHVAALADREPVPADHAGDLFLACACANDVPGAAAVLQRSFGKDLERAVSRVSSERAFVADAVQALYERVLLARADAPPRIAEYAGRAPLRSWLVASAMRVAFNLRRSKSDAPHDALSSGTGAIVDAAPELEILRRRYKGELEDAIRKALTSLPARDRTLLRLHLVERMGIDGLARSFGVGRSTTARWLAAAREALLEHAQSAFRERVNVTPSEFESIARALKSDLDVSLAAHLGSSRAPA